MTRSSNGGRCRIGQSKRGEKKKTHTVRTSEREVGHGCLTRTEMGMGTGRFACSSTRPDAGIVIAVIR